MVAIALVKVVTRLYLNVTFRTIVVFPTHCVLFSEENNGFLAPSMIHEPGTQVFLL